MLAEPHLPEEILAAIFAYLDPRSLSSAAQANRTFYRIATSPHIWQVPFLLRWTTGDPVKQRQRRLEQWTSDAHATQLQRWALAAKQLSQQNGEDRASSASQSVQLTAEQPTASAFLLFRPQRSQALAAAGSNEEDIDAPPPHFYRLFLERIAIDQQVLDLLYEQVEAVHARIPAADELRARFGADAKDILQALVAAQLSGPSGSISGSPTCDQADSSSYRLRAYDVHLPTTFRSDSHHLVILHHARELLEHLQRVEAMQGLKQIDSEENGQAAAASIGGTLSPEHRTERAVSLLSMFRGGEIDRIREGLDALAAACDLYLQRTRPALMSDAAQSMSSDGRLPEETAKLLALAIGDYLKAKGFKGARPGVFQDLDNHFLHYCLDSNRETIPLSLVTIFCAVASRLGLRASLCNFPTRILAVINFTSLNHSADDGRFWLDVAEYTSRPGDPPGSEDEASATSQFAPILTQADLQRWTEQLNLAHRTDFVTPASASEMVVRAARNIVASVQRAQIMPRHGRATEHADEAEVVGASSARRGADGETVDALFLKLRSGWVPTEEQPGTYQLQGTTGDAPPENAAAWKVLKRFRAESGDRRSSSTASTARADCRAAFRESIEARRAADDWATRSAARSRRATSWSEHDQQAAMYAAANGFVRLTDELGDRGADWVAGLIQSYFPLDVGEIERDFLALDAATVASSWPTPRAAARRRAREQGGAAAEEEEENHSESGSDSSFEGSFSGREESGQAAEEARRSAGRTYMRNPGVRFLLSTTMQTVRKKDAAQPKINRRPGRAARLERLHRSGAAETEAGASTSHRRVIPAAGVGLDDANNMEQEEEDPVTFRVGTLFRHRTYGYLGCVLGWDPYCAAPDEWILNHGVDNLPPPSSGRQPPLHAASAAASLSSTTGGGRGGRVDEWADSPTSPPAVRDGLKSARMKRDKRGGRHQPFYHAQVADGTRRYVAEVNVIPLPRRSTSAATESAATEAGRMADTTTVERDGGHTGQAQGRGQGETEEEEDLATLLRLRGLGEYFRSFDERTRRMHRNEEVRRMFPDDWSDEEEEEGEGGGLGLLHPSSRSAQSTVSEARGGREQVEILSEDGSW